jgi:hypothetical protein
MQFLIKVCETDGEAGNEAAKRKKIYINERFMNTG